ncbi:growth arrest and DNA damage-inducible protein GADD45 alpha-like [Argopecten irradians]|uniref:growth arrest and DNA damage-inducible protein GADD45 alpha-like n=1 Tax=Argopecten irradians TaxID=31199 RepID=UPI0037113489
MTLTEIDNNKEHRRNMAKISFALKEALQQAVKEGRTTIGGYECAKQMQGKADRFAYCVFPEQTTDDAMTSIERILLEAYCREHRIRIVRVGNSKNLGKVICKLSNKRYNRESDYNCVLVEKSRNSVNADEVMFMDCHREAIKKDPWYVTEIPL